MNPVATDNNSKPAGVMVHCRAGGGKKIAIVIAFLEDGGLAGGSCCSRLVRAGVQVLKVAAGPEIVTLATVILVAVSKGNCYNRMYILNVCIAICIPMQCL